MSNNSGWTFGGTIPCTSWGIEHTTVADGVAVAAPIGTVEMEMQFDRSPALVVLMHLARTVDFSECDKAAIANPWYGGWGIE